MKITFSETNHNQWMPVTARQQTGNSYSGLYPFFRRAFDILFSIVLAPFCIVIIITAAVFIATESPGRIFFVQKRPGKNGVMFLLYKLRTMYKSADDAFLTAKNDSRVTRAGKFLRRYRLDEIPQVYNVLIGDMSFIGPRPAPENFYMEFKKKIPGYEYRHVVKPGITGLAQITIGYTNTLEGEIKKLEFDLHYINNMSFKTDCFILWKTIQSIFTEEKKPYMK